MPQTFFCRLVPQILGHETTTHFSAKISGKRDASALQTLLATKQYPTFVATVVAQPAAETHDCRQKSARILETSRFLARFATQIQTARGHLPCPALPCCGGLGNRFHNGIATTGTGIPWARFHNGIATTGTGIPWALRSGDTERAEGDAGSTSTNPLVGGAFWVLSGEDSQGSGHQSVGRRPVQLASTGEAPQCAVPDAVRCRGEQCIHSRARCPGHRARRGTMLEL